MAVYNSITASYNGIMLRTIGFTLGLLVIGNIVKAQFAPQVPFAGNDAISVNDTRFVAWATGCTINRGWMDIADTTLGKADLGEPQFVIGKPNAQSISLGDGGSVLLTFDAPIVNGEGPDFAVFENGFPDPLNDTLAFLELAFVEVSSNGVDFFRFPATSLMQDNIQINNDNYSNAIFYNNLAGKYINNYGTPFDLATLENTPGLDVNNITHVKIIDVIGNIDKVHSTYDQQGNVINDPYPTPFNSGGFDLKGIGVLHQGATPNGIASNSSLANNISVYPNPTQHNLNLKQNHATALQYRISDITGKILLQGSTETTHCQIPVHHMVSGLYFIIIENEQGACTAIKWQKL
jgi:hypothetical protein